MTASHTPRKPAAERRTRVITSRVTDEQFNHLVAQAAIHELTLAEAIREAVQRDLDAQPDIPIEGNAPGGSGLSYRSFLANADFSAALEELKSE